MAVRVNPDGSISVGILGDFAKDMNVPVIEETAAEAAKAETKPKTKRTAKSVKK